MRVIGTFRELLGDSRGATAVEYGLILAFVFLAMVGAVQAFGLQVTGMFNDVSSQSVSAMNGAV